MPTKRLTDAGRAAILAAVRDPDDRRSRAQLARDFETSPSTIRRLVDGAGIVNPWDTSGTRAATVAARDHLKSRRAAVSARFLDEAEYLLDKIRRPATVFAFGGRDNEYNSRELPEPPAADVRNLMTSAAVAFDKHLAADKHDADDHAADGISMVGKLAEGLDAAYRRLTAGEPGEPTPADEPDDAGGGEPA
ncbi:hypothetical protein [Pseudonocardia sp. McavD-2-B]|uniref:hypothetical protein n=1 Tax=Pseudonocardia sp. McavD-2-B TaxID=2954499 RepID=UPI002097CB82|nr:hypothetical protein [Pseudonocardia sp. McavD-2-B]MCO7197449.1 hypothetical protein [Pseudonocardia sp. McavD-2-B]